MWIIRKIWKNGCCLLKATLLLAVLLATVSCGTKKVLTDTSAVSNSQAKNEAEKMSVFNKVRANEANLSNLSSKIKFTISSGSKDFSVSGSLKMRKDEVIRIQLVPLGLMEAGRLEFSKDNVLLMDRMNKEYVQAAYSEVDFLRDNGLDFVALQALFWNKLFLPGEKITESSLKKFDVELPVNSTQATVSHRQGDMNYLWSVDKTSGLIKSVEVTYQSRQYGKTTVDCTYDGFKVLNGRQFPTVITLSMQTDALKRAKKMTLKLSLGSFDTSSDWDAKTTIGGKYKKVDAQDLMNKLLSM